MVLTIEDSILEHIHLSENELRIEFAIFLYQTRKITLSQASRLANIDRIEFQKCLRTRSIPIQYTKQDLEQDLETIKLIQK